MKEGKKSTRQAYGEALLEVVANDNKVIVLDADLSKSTRSVLVKEKYPDRFYNIGIAEQNMVSIAAGLASCGFIPFASTLSVFATQRACDQLIVSVCYPKLNVKLVGTHAGISIGKDGVTHQAVSDIAITRSIPNLTVIVPADAAETKKAAAAIAKMEGPVYLRLGRAELPYIFDESYDFQIGKGNVVVKGKDAAIVANGIMLHGALEAREILLKEGIDVEVVNMATVKPLDENLLLEEAKKFGALVVAEEHNIAGGVGSAVSEYLSGICPVPIVRVGIKNCFAESGSPEDLFKKYELSAGDIANGVKRALNLRGENARLN